MLSWHFGRLCAQSPLPWGGTVSEVGNSHCLPTDTGFTCPRTTASSAKRLQVFLKCYRTWLTLSNRPIPELRFWWISSLALYSWIDSKIPPRAEMGSTLLLSLRTLETYLTLIIYPVLTYTDIGFWCFCSSWSSSLTLKIPSWHKFSWCFVQHLSSSLTLKIPSWHRFLMLL